MADAPTSSASDRLQGDADVDERRVDERTGELRQETMIINMGPQHPSTHGVLRLLLELDGETVIQCTPIIGYLHTGIEKNTEYRTWMQGVTYVTRADYLSPFFNELGYCLAVERLLGIEAPPRAQVIRVLMNVVPAALLVLFRKRLVPDAQERKLWLWMAVFAFACLPLVGLASTAVDRVALYLIPIQLFVFARVPRLARTVQTRTPLVLGVLAYYAAVLFVWLNFATHAFAWVPYQNVLFL